MTEATNPVNGGAMSKPNRKAIMTRAWAIFRQTYNYPTMPFAKIGRDCFAWALKQAWAEAREAARIAAIDVTTRETRIDSLTRSIELEQFNDSWPMARANIALRQTVETRTRRMICQFSPHLKPELT